MLSCWATKNRTCVASSETRTTGTPCGSGGGFLAFRKPAIRQTPLTDPSRFGRSVRPGIPVLGTRDVGHAPLAAVPAVEPVHAKCPEAGILVARHDEAVGVADVH